MSLLKESFSTVLAGENLVLNGVGNNPLFTGYNNLNGYHVISGAILPREQGNYLVLDNRTGDPIVFPANSSLFQAYFVPTVPLECADLDNVNLQLRLWDDLSFTNSFIPTSSAAVMDFSGTMANSRVFVQVDDGEPMSDYIGYPYIGLAVSNEDITAGVLQVYIYYQTALTPPVV